MTVADAHAREVTSPGGYRPDIQGLRTIAIVFVVIYHAGLPFPGGFTGVDIFFVISGFVITSTLTRRFRAGTAQLGRFYLARIRRLLPALAVMLTLVLLASMAIGTIGAMGTTARTGASAALINANTYLMLFDVGGYFDASSALNPLLHTWSLSVEEQFYLVFPGLLAIGWFGLRRARRAVQLGREQLVLLLILVLSFALSMYFAFTVPSDDIGSLWGRINYYSAFTRAWEFAAGGVLAVAPMLLVRGRRASMTIAALGMGMLLVGLFIIHEDVVFPNPLALLPVVGTALLISAGSHEPSNHISRALAVKPMVTLGDLSYGWYLWHWPFIVFAGILFVGNGAALLIAATVSLCVAWLSFRFIENPIRYRKNPSRKSTIQVAVTCVAIPLLAALGLSLWHSNLKSNDALNPFALHQDSLLDCDSPASLAHKPSGCTWTFADATGRAVLVGDSLAGQYSESFVAGMHANGLTAQIATFSGCPFIDFGDKRKQARALGMRLDAECSAFVRRTMSDLLANPPEVLVLSSSAQRFIKSGDDSDRSALFVRARKEMLERLRAAGIAVAIINPLTKYPGWGAYEEGPFKEATAISVLNGGSSEVPQLTRTEVEAQLSAARSAEESSARAANTLVLDFIDQVCTDESCAAKKGDTWTYRDFEHLSVAAAKGLSGEFSRAGAALLKQAGIRR